MIRRGIRTNPPAVARAMELYTADLEAAKALAAEHAPTLPLKLTPKRGLPAKRQPTFNLGSSTQLIWYCRQKGYTVPLNKETKKPTVDDDALTLLLEAHPDDPILLARQQYMGARQIISHYLVPMQAERIYPEILIHSQASGRWSIVDPPLQQPPHDLYERMECKDPWAGLIVPDEGEAWIVFDWSQVEYRLLAVLAQDVPALAAYAEGRDLHAENSDLIFGHHDAAYRNFTKRFVFRLHYRGEPRSSGDIPGARALGLTGARLVPLAQRYLAGHPAIRRYWSRQDDEIRARKEQRTFCGRRRRTTSPKLGHKVFKELGNHPLQGGVADILNLTVIAIDHTCPWTRLVTTIHDSVILACPIERIDETVPLVHEIVHHEWDVEGHKTVFPAEIKVVYPPKKEASCEPS